MAGFGLLKTVFPNFGDTLPSIDGVGKGTFMSSGIVEQSYNKILNEPMSSQMSGSELETGLRGNWKPNLKEDDIAQEFKMPSRPEITRIENFTPPPSRDHDHSLPQYENNHLNFSHLMECQECRQLFMTHMSNINKSDSLYDNDTLLEIGIYVLFGVFILTLLETK
jgi:hypothetical protein